MNEQVKILVDISKINLEQIEILLEQLGFQVVHNHEEVLILKQVQVNADYKALNRLDFVVSVEPMHQFKALEYLKRTFTLGESEIGKEFAVIAGPCAVESREQLFNIAHEIFQQGLSLLRGGTFKIRTSPYAFQGLGMDALQMLRDVADRYHMAIVSEVVDPQHARLAAPYIDCLQIGSRNMHNTALLRAAAATRKPILLKRGFASTIEEWLYAAEYLALEGAREVIFCERGIRTFEPSMRFTLDLAGAVLLKQRTGLPVFIDPSHATGNPNLITPLVLAARAAGLDGVMVEVHENPLVALSDGAQALDFPSLEDMLHALDSLSV